MKQPRLQNQPQNRGNKPPFSYPRYLKLQHLYLGSDLSFSSIVPSLLSHPSEVQLKS